MIRRYHRALQECPKHIAFSIMRYFKTVEHLFAMFMDTEEIMIIHDAIELMQSETFSIPKNISSKKFKFCKDTSGNASIGDQEEDLIEKASIYGAFVCGVKYTHRC